VTLAADEILADLVPPDRVVAVTKYVDDPTVSNAVGRYSSSVARIGAVDLEQVVALEPDLVIYSQHNDADFVELVHETGLRARMVAAHASFADVRRTYLELGEAVGEPERAREVATWIEESLDELERIMATVEERPRLLYWANGMTTGPGTTLGEVIERAGAHNVAADLGIEGTVELDTERALAARPDVILLSRWRLAEEEGYTDLPPALKGLYSVESGNVIALEGRLLESLSARLVVGAWTLASRLHPERIDPAVLARIQSGPPGR